MGNKKRLVPPSAKLFAPWAGRAETDRLREKFAPSNLGLNFGSRGKSTGQGAHRMEGELARHCSGYSGRSARAGMSASEQSGI